jgi:hypothetical protein
MVIGEVRMAVIRPGKKGKPTISKDKNNVLRVTNKQPPKSELQKWLDKDTKAAKKLLK